MVAVGDVLGFGGEGLDHVAEGGEAVFLEFVNFDVLGFGGEGLDDVAEGGETVWIFWKVVKVFLT